MTPQDVRATAATLEGVSDGSTPERLGFSYADRGIAWTFMQRDRPKEKRWPNIDVLAVCCPLERKELLIEAAPDKFFTDPHYNGFPAVLVRLPNIDAGELTEMLQGACEWASKPKRRKKPA